MFVDNALDGGDVGVEDLVPRQQTFVVGQCAGERRILSGIRKVAFIDGARLRLVRWNATDEQVEYWRPSIARAVCSRRDQVLLRQIAFNAIDALERGLDHPRRGECPA